MKYLLGPRLNLAVVSTPALRQVPVDPVCQWVVDSACVTPVCSGKRAHERTAWISNPVIFAILPAGTAVFPLSTPIEGWYSPAPVWRTRVPRG